MGSTLGSASRRRIAVCRHDSSSGPAARTNDAREGRLEGPHDGGLETRAGGSRSTRRSPTSGRRRRSRDRARALPVDDHRPGPGQDHVLRVQVRVQQHVTVAAAPSPKGDRRASPARPAAGTWWTRSCSRASCRACARRVHGRRPKHVKHGRADGALHHDVGTGDVEDLGHRDAARPGVRHHLGFAGYPRGCPARRGTGAAPARPRCHTHPRYAPTRRAFLAP